MTFLKHLAWCLARGASARVRRRRGSGGGGRSSATRGVALLVTFLLMLVLSGLALAVGVFSHNSLVGSKAELLDKQAFYIAEAGWQRARQALVASTWLAAAVPGNTYTESFGAGEYRVTVVDNGDGTDTITSDGYVPNQPLAAARRRVVETGLSASTSGSTNLSPSAAAIAASSQSGVGNQPANANDGNTATKWQASIKGSGEWLRLDFGSATTLNQAIIVEHSDIDGVTVEASSDGSTWATVTGLSVVESPSKTWTAVFTSTSARYFRAIFTSPSNGTAGVKEFESYDAVLTLGQGAVTTQW